jgi:hypothetical protein
VLVWYDLRFTRIKCACLIVNNNNNNNNNNSLALVPEQTMPTERVPTFADRGVSRG